MVFVDKQLQANKAPVPAGLVDEREVRLLGVTHAEVGAYVLPVKKAVRSAEGLDDGDVAEVTIRLVDR